MRIATAAWEHPRDQVALILSLSKDEGVLPLQTLAAASAASTRLTAFTTAAMRITA